jgi:hypothetical protein
MRPSANQCELSGQAGRPAEPTSNYNRQQMLSGINSVLSKILQHQALQILQPPRHTKDAVCQTRIWAVGRILSITSRFLLAAIVKLVPKTCAALPLPSNIFHTLPEINRRVTDHNGEQHGQSAAI